MTKSQRKQDDINKVTKDAKNNKPPLVMTGLERYRLYLIKQGVIK